MAVSRPVRYSAVTPSTTRALEKDYLIRRSKFGWLLPLALGCGLPASGQSVSLPEALAAARYPLVVSDRGLSGAGADILKTAVESAAFVLLGEDHLTQEIPRFAAAVCEQMVPHGLTAMVLETSPAAAHFAQNAASSPDHAEQMAALQQQYPESIAFLSDRQEDDLASQCTAANADGQQIALWGLDQEFLGAAGWMTERMIATGPGPKAMTALRTMRHDEQQMAMDAKRTGSLNDLYLLRASDRQIAIAATAIQADGKPETRAIFSDLMASRSLYLQHEKDFRGSNARRATLLEQNFLQNYEKARKSAARPRLLVKFGDTHLYRGFNELHELNLGNFIAELADVSGEQSLHILVLGVAGEHARYVGYGKAFARDKFVLEEDPDYHWLAAAVAARKEVSASGPWTLYDLRKLRFGRVATLDTSWERVVYGYDLLVLIPNTTSAELLQ